MCVLNKYIRQADLSRSLIWLCFFAVARAFVCWVLLAPSSCIQLYRALSLAVEVKLILNMIKDITISCVYLASESHYSSPFYLASHRPVTTQSAVLLTLKWRRRVQRYIVIAFFANLWKILLNPKRTLFCPGSTSLLRWDSYNR